MEYIHFEKVWPFSCVEIIRIFNQDFIFLPLFFFAATGIALCSALPQCTAPRLVWNKIQNMIKNNMDVNILGIGFILILFPLNKEFR